MKILCEVFLRLDKAVFSVKQAPPSGGLFELHDDPLHGAQSFLRPKSASDIIAVMDESTLIRKSFLSIAIPHFYLQVDVFSSLWFNLSIEYCGNTAKLLHLC